MTNLVQAETPFVVNWTRQNYDRLTRFCSANIEQFATEAEAIAAAERPFEPLVVDVMVRKFDLNANKAVIIAKRKRGKKLVRVAVQ